MPELPEVEVLARQLTVAVVGARVVGAWARPEPKWASAAGTRGPIVGVARRGKYLLLAVGGDTLVLHLGMTGRLELDVPGAPGPDHVVVRLELDDGRRLSLCDPRRFGRATLTAAPDRVLAHLGLDPLDAAFDGAVAARQLAGRSRRIKEVLLDQGVVSGVGNYLADESLWRAGVHPEARHLSVTRARRLLTEVARVMDRSIAAGGASMRDYRNLDGVGRAALALECYGRAGLGCTRCGAPLRKGVVAGRGTTWCGRCQRR